MNGQSRDEFKRDIHQQLLERLNLHRSEIASLSAEVLRQRAESVVRQLLIEKRWQIPEGITREGIVAEILDEALGLGPLEQLLADDAVSEIMVNAYDDIFVERGGVLEPAPQKFSSERAVLNAIERILAPIGRRIDESSPLVDARLKDGSRVNAAIRPVALDGPCITIRKFAKTPLTSADLVRFGAMTQGMAEFLKLAVEQRKNVVISGGTGSGKTTLLNVVSSFIPGSQRVITIEDSAELQLPLRHVVRFESRPPNIEGEGAVDASLLVKNALRMRPDRIVIGECRGGEALAMLQAMNTGHAGSMTTGHANTPRDMLSRLETMVLMAGMDLPIRAIRQQIASAVNIIVQQTRFSCGTRKITSIVEVTGMDPDDGSVLTEEVFRFIQHGFDERGRVTGIQQPTGYIPRFLRDMMEEGKAVDTGIFQS